MATRNVQRIVEGITVLLKKIGNSRQQLLFLQFPVEDTVAPKPKGRPRNRQKLQSSIVQPAGHPNHGQIPDTQGIQTLQSYVNIFADFQSIHVQHV